MNSLLDDDDEDVASGESRELTLGTGTILAIFVGLALLCGAFFGFGYKMGSHKPATPFQAATASENAVAPSATFNTFKPAAGSPASGSPTSAPAPLPRPAPAPVEQDNPVPPPSHVAPATRTPTEAVTTTSVVATGSIVVQVAAFTHQEDADSLVHALKAKSYPAFARSEPQDKLFHIQVGPFTNRKDAEAAKQRLLTDGYQPILK